MVNKNFTTIYKLYIQYKMADIWIIDWKCYFICLFYILFLSKKIKNLINIDHKTSTFYLM